MINFPKTGTTFARKMLEELYQKKRKKESIAEKLYCLLQLKKRPLFKNIMLPQTEFVGGNNAKSHQHGRWEQIPNPYKDRPVVGIVRNPYERNISNYEYRWWANHPIAPREVLIDEFPNFPDLSFEEYIRYQNFNTRYRINEIKLKTVLGNQTVQFIQFFFKDPRRVLSVIDDEYIGSGAYREDMPNITFLKTENLNEDLYCFLLKHGHNKEELAFILDRKRLRPENTKRSSDQERKNYLTKDLIDLINWQERLLFKIYQDYGIIYNSEYSGPQK